MKEVVVNSASKAHLLIDLEDGIARIERALEKAPFHRDWREDLAKALRLAGRDDQAAVCPYGVPQMNASRLESLYPGEDATPYEAIPNAERHWTHRKQARKAEKCTFCWHKLERAVQDGKTDRIGKDPEYTPACDLVCPVDARLFGDLDDPNSAVAKAVGQRKGARLKTEFGTEPRVFYVLEGGER